VKTVTVVIRILLELELERKGKGKGKGRLEVMRTEAEVRAAVGSVSLNWTIMEYHPPTFHNK